MEHTSFAPMDDKHLGQFGENTARAMRAEGNMRGRAVWRDTLGQLREIRCVRDRISARRGPEEGAAEWLLDNWYLAQREGRNGAEAFRRVRCIRYVLRGGRVPLIMELARAFVRAAGKEAGPERLAIFLERAQEGQALTEQELSLLIPALKCALTERLATLCRELEHLEDADEAALRAGMEAVFTALRMLATAELTGLLEDSSRVEQTLCRDPAGVYPAMDDETRARYRAQVCRLARQEGVGEAELAEHILLRAAQSSGRERHVGAWLFPPHRQIASRYLYIGGIVLMTGFLALLAGFLLHSPWAAVLLALPISDIVKNSADFLVVRMVRPRPVFRMALEEGIPREGRTLCVIASLLTGEKSGGELAALLERYHLANRDAGRELRLGLLCDLPDRDRPMGEREQTWVETASAAVEQLNKAYGGGFYLFFRVPVFHAPDQRYMGWERKRGALVELVRLLRGKRTGLRTEAGDSTWLRGVRYVITLDADTALSVGSAKELAGAMLHPLNRPVIDRRRGVVVSGYGLLQPRVAVDLESANRSHFSRIFAGQGGVDPYGSAASDVYHDLFGEGTYTGKGIFDVDAFLACLDRRLPQNAVLSHDLLEGSYLHAGLIGDVELTDGYPYQVSSYFSRLHRWVRGDWQLLPWLGRSVRNEEGERIKNPLGDLPRWKIVDNLRRSLSPVGTLTALLLSMCISGPVFALAAGTAVLSAASNLLLTGADLAARRGRGLAERYHSTIIAGVGGVLLQTLVQLLFLPQQAWTCASAAGTALWRMAVTRRGMLAWTTAAEAERRAGDSLWAYYRRLWPLAAAGVFCVFFSQFPAGAAAGLVWLAGPCFAWNMSRPIRQNRAVPAGERPFLLHQGAMIWQYFSDFLRPQDHYLPPDNYQEQPGVGLARRTSPTNIGMALLSCMAAADLELVPQKQALALMEQTLSSVERLEKWRGGHLYNWYDTATERPLEPRYVSSVDSGNLCGCLIALREGLLEWGEEGLARRADALAAAMDFSLLFDESRRLFYIGFDCGRGEYTQGWYDLLASEARQTSYLAVARGEVPRRHWRRLSRALVGQDHYCGMASWTGTMFEYFMPHLLLPAEQNSLLYESLAFCLYAQKKRVRGTGAPWGISESAFYAFDGAMNYQYKAHGVQRLGLKRGLDRELVVSPYSTFLTLPLAPEGGVKNLRALAAMGLEGRYGLCEAADFTPGRVNGGAKYEPVRSYMAHHLGMSLVALDNALNDGIMQKRFMRDAAMGAYRELLQEKVPVGAQVLRSPRDEVPDKPGRRGGEPFLRTGEGYDPVCPACHLMTGGAWQVLCTDAGASWSRMGRTTLTRCIWNRQYQSAGVSFFLRTPEGLLPLTPAPLYREEPEYTWRFQGGGACWSAQWQGYAASVDLRVPERENGERREVTVRWTGEGEREVELLCYLEPVLAPREDYEAHPAFSKLSLESKGTGDGVLFTRRNRRRGESRPALAVLWDQPEATFDTARETALGRGGLQALEGAVERPATEREGAVLDPCLLVRFPVSLRSDAPVQIRLALSAADSGEQATEGALRLLRMRGGEAADGLEQIRGRLQLTEEETRKAFELLRNLQFPAHPWVSRGSPEQRALWPFGISGDLPIAALRVEEERMKAALSLERIHQFLVQGGFMFDLVFLMREGGDYLHPLRDTLEERLRSDGWEHRLGARGGIFLVEEETAAAVCAAALLLDEVGNVPQENRSARGYEKQNTFTQLPGIPPFGFLENGSFWFDTGAQLPPLGWSTILCNDAFGWRTDETGSGHLWINNAKENPLTEWVNDPLAVTGPERVLFSAGGGEVSCFAAPDGLPCTVTYGFGEAMWEKHVAGSPLRCTAFVPPDEDARYLLLEAEGRTGEVIYRLEGAEEQRWPIRGYLCLRTVPAPGGRWPETGPADFNRARERLEQTRAWWSFRVSPLTLRTPDEALDRYLNGWALYQVIACRLFARTSLYQNGGAYGFRDQLQDVCAVLLTAPELARAQLLRACAHQYEEGDVQHWWHPAAEGETERGVRTRISDDLLWLPYVLCEYLEKTGDRDILEVPVSFLVSPTLAENERERYEAAETSAEKAGVLEHARRAVEQALRRGTGPHGLAKMGTGDWNDGMDLVGAAGTGESVWLTWFLALVLERFASLCSGETRACYAAEARRYASAANAAWDGEWFLRGWYDDGQTLGASADQACRIDSIAQSFAVLCPLGDRDRAHRAVKSAMEHLFDREHQIVKLFAPPFDEGERDPGYIRGYLPGVRENGGQYTHAAVWLALALFRLGRGDEGHEVLHALLPAAHAPACYQAEPYVLAADVYANPQHPGRGGWSWYTGAAGWFYRTAVEELLGLRVREGRLYMEPCLPQAWSGYEAEWALTSGCLHLKIERTGTRGLLLDGKPCGDGIPLNQLRGEHQVLFSF